MRKWLVLGVLCGLAMMVRAQSGDQILFKVEDIEVPVSEFTYIYEKNNREGADYSKESLDEYFELYAKFKLKVQKARDLQLDTIGSLSTELEGYRRQLARSYLNDKEVTDRLTREAYERKLKDVHVAHILFGAPSTASDEVKAGALEKAKQAKARIDAGESFEAIAAELSDDGSTKENGGDLGYLTAMLPGGFYEMENAMYTMEPGQVSDPIQTSLGYHILTVLDRREARGRVEISHILARINEQKSNVSSAKNKIDGIYRNLQNGIKFDQLAKSVSDDTKTARRGGYIGKVGTGEFDEEFEEAAFALENPGDYSEPVRTKVGWHIIKLINKVPFDTYEDEKRKLEAAMAGDERMEIARKAMIDRIKEESGFIVDSAALKSFIAKLDEDFMTFKWDVPELSADGLISFSDGTGETVVDFAEYCRTNPRLRMRTKNAMTPEDKANELFGMFANDACIAYEESRLAEKYPDFAALMREYEEGILLFEVTKMMVWDKAAADTAGLIAYHEQHRKDYMWPERASVTSYIVKSQDEKQIMKAYEDAAAMTSAEWLEKINKKEEIGSIETRMMTEEEVDAAGWQWSKGYRTPVITDPALGAAFSKVEEIIPPRAKELDEARGYIIADYQDYIEKQWVKELTEEYEVLVNEELFESLVRQQ